MDILERICADKRVHIALQKKRKSTAALLHAAKSAKPVRSFALALREKARAGTFGLIAELKKASPSGGLIREDFDPAALARAYEKGGAACLSVLTDAPYFQGNDRYLTEARAATLLPMLRKDFMIDPYQVAESRALGADCILVIMASVEDALAAELAAGAKAFGMDVLVEIHDERELERALKIDSALIGINNRNLKTLKVDLATTETLAPLIPRTHLIVCESGIHTHADLQRMEKWGVRCFLVGESLMRKPNLEAATQSLLNG